MPQKTRYRLNSPPILHETIDHETIVVNLDVGTYYSLNPAASVIWNALDGGGSIEEIIESLAAQSGAPHDAVDRSVRVFLEQLIQAELVVASDNGNVRRELPSWPE